MDKSLDTVKPSDLLLLHYYFVYLIFTETPSVKEQTITVTMHDVGKDYSASKKIVFD